MATLEQVGAGLPKWDDLRLSGPVKLSDVFPPSGHVQRLYCDDCRRPLDLTSTNFHEDVSGVDMSIAGLPVLRCVDCNKDYLPDKSRFAIIESHKRATEKGMSSVSVTRRKLTERNVTADVIQEAINQLGAIRRWREMSWPERWRWLRSTG